MYLKNIQDNSYINEDLLQKITKAYKALMVLMSDTCDKMKEISNLWKLLYDKSLKYYETTYTSESYKVMNKIIEDFVI